MVIAGESDEGKAKDCICREKREREGEGSHSSGVGIGKTLIVDRASRAVTVTAQHRELPSEEEPPPYTDAHTYRDTARHEAGKVRDVGAFPSGTGRLGV